MNRKSPSVVWICPSSLKRALDKATWTETAAELCKIGWDVTLVTTDPPRDELDSRIHVVSLPWPRTYLFGYLVFHIFLLLHIFFLSFRKDVVLFDQMSSVFILPLPILRRLLQRRFPKFILDSRTLPMNVNTRRAKAQAIFMIFGNHLANYFADGQTAITERLAQALRVPSGQLLGVWPSGVKVEKFVQAVDGRAWPSNTEPIRLVYIGSLASERNLLCLSECVLTAASEGLYITLDIIGDGQYKLVLQDFVRKSGKGLIMVRDPVPHSNIPGILADFHIGVLPFPDLLNFRVSSPIKLFEYMAAGIPILATQVVCHTDVLQKADFVFWAKDSSKRELLAAIRNACSRKSELCFMGTKALQAARKWTWGNSAQKLSAALFRALE